MANPRFNKQTTNVRGTVSRVKKRNGSKINDFEELGRVDSEKAYTSKGKSVKKQTANDKLDESLGMKDGKESTKTQSFKDRRDESKGE